MVYWERCTDDGSALPISIKELARVLGETGWHRSTHFFGASQRSGGGAAVTHDDRAVTTFSPYYPILARR